MKSTELIHDITSHFGGNEKQELMSLLNILRTQSQRELYYKWRRHLMPLTNLKTLKNL